MSGSEYRVQPIQWTIVCYLSCFVAGRPLLGGRSKLVIDPPFSTWQLCGRMHSVLALDTYSYAFAGQAPEGRTEGLQYDWPYWRPQPQRTAEEMCN